jgi:hypothetical protein
MDVVTVHLRTSATDGRLDSVVERILGAFKGARITQEDWYADARRAAEKTIEACKNAGKPMPNPEIVLRDIDSAALEIGPRKILAIPMDAGGYLKADITKDGLLLIADVSLENNQTVSALVGLLSSMGIVASVQPRAKRTN